MFRSVASVPDNWICNFSSPRNESDIHGSGGIIGVMKDDAIEIDGFESREIRCPNEFLRTRTSPDEGPCGTRPAADTRRSGGSSTTTRMVSLSVGGMIGSNGVGG